LIRSITNWTRITPQACQYFLYMETDWKINLKQIFWNNVKKATEDERERNTMTKLPCRWWCRIGWIYGDGDWGCFCGESTSEHGSQPASEFAFSRSFWRFLSNHLSLPSAIQPKTVCALPPSTELLIITAISINTSKTPVMHQKI